MVFAITSPRLTHVASAIEKVNIGLVVRDAAVVVAERLVVPMQQAAKNAGASPQMVTEIRVHDGHLNQLVMRGQGSYGDVIVGVDGASRVADEAEELEWGGLHVGPKAWVRTTTARHAADVNRMWSDEISRELDRKTR